MESVDVIQLEVWLVWRILDSFTHMTDALAGTTGRLGLAKSISFTQKLGSVRPFSLHVVSKPVHEVPPEGCQTSYLIPKNSKGQCSKG